MSKLFSKQGYKSSRFDTRRLYHRPKHDCINQHLATRKIEIQERKVGNNQTNEASVQGICHEKTNSHIAAMP